VNPFLQHKSIAFLKLIRVENLIIIAFAQYCLRYLVLHEILEQHQIQSAMEGTLFHLMVLSTLLIAAAGYIINDYFDIKTDLINHPETVVVDRVIKRRWAIILHLSFTTLGLFLGVYAALKTGYLRLAGFHILAATLLWFYSTHFKKQLLTGNLVVAILTASATFMPFVFEMGVLQHVFPGFHVTHTIVILACLKASILFSLFSFLTTLAREIIKDLEDFKGDALTGSRTMPISWGIITSKVFTCFTLLITIILLSVIIYSRFKIERHLFSLNSLYIFIGLILPLSVLIGLVVKAQHEKHYKISSLLLKGIMLIGIFYCFIFN
jgi:4-hydroxybenzoate polyprenyltransferase